MPVERRNPLPVGRYWVAAMDTRAMQWLDTWFRQNATNVKVVKKEEHTGSFGFGLEPDSSLLNPSTWTWGAVGHGKWDWYLFDVLQPTLRWKSGIQGLSPWPNVVRSAVNPTGPDVATAADTVQKPPDVTLTDWVSDVLTDVKTVAIIAAALYFMSSNKR